MSQQQKQKKVPLILYAVSSLLIASGVATAITGAIPAGIIVSAAGLALAAFYQARMEMDESLTPISRLRR